MNLRCLVTGGAGFIGSHIIEQLLFDNHTVRIIDDLSSGNIDNIQPYISKIEFIQDSITNIAAVEKAVANVDAVFHLAAMPFVVQTISEPVSSTNVNFNGTLNLLEASRSARVKAFVFASSSAVYGNSEKMPVKEDLPLNPISPYAAAKLASEYFVSLYAQTYNLPAISLRFMNVFGERQNPDSLYSAVIPRFIKNMLVDKPIEIFGDGTQTRDFIYVKNVAKANIQAMNKLINKELQCGIFNIGSGIPTCINTLVDMLADELDISPQKIESQAKDGEIKHSFSDISHAEKLLEYKPEVSFNNGLKKLIKYFKKVDV